MEDNQPESLSEVQSFYTDKTIFITGGSGFLGKAILEKILRSCSTFKKIYLLLRSKKGKDFESRLEELFKSEIFSIVKQENPEVLERVVPINGDLYSPDLDLSNADRESILRETNIVIHSGASVRFAEPLSKIAKINVTSVEVLLKLARKMPQLQAYVHISSSFANSNRLEIKEQFYDPPMNYQELQTLTKTISESVLDKITPNLLGKFRNNYSFSKNIAEDCVRRLGKDLPVVIFRPALINSSYKEPMPGWNDSLYGIMGLATGYSMGLLRVLICDTEIPVPIVPLDYCANLTTVLAYQVAKEIKQNEYDGIKIYNFTPFNNHLNFEQFLDMVLTRYKKRPSIKTMWKNIMYLCKNEWLFMFLSFFLHYIPGLIMDAGLLLSGKKTRVIKLYQMIHKLIYIYAYFLKTEFKFGNENQVKLWDSLSEPDKQRFQFNISTMDWNDYMDNFAEGVYRFHLKEDLTIVDAARKKYARLTLYHNLLVFFLVIFGLSVIWWLFSLFF